MTGFRKRTRSRTCSSASPPSPRQPSSCSLGPSTGRRSVDTATDSDRQSRTVPTSASAAGRAFVDVVVCCSRIVLLVGPGGGLWRSVLACLSWRQLRAGTSPAAYRCVRAGHGSSPRSACWRLKGADEAVGPAYSRGGLSSLWSRSGLPGQASRRASRGHAAGSVMQRDGSTRTSSSGPISSQPGILRKLALDRRWLGTR